MAELCQCGSTKSKSGNCPFLGTDGISVQCVGPWIADKHHYLERYISATRGARKKYLEPEANRPAGGAAFIDLFAGPGRARIRDSGDEVDGSPLIALKHTEAAFTKVILAELSLENAAALTVRTQGHADRVSIVAGDCNENIGRIIEMIPEHGLNIALIDPYGLLPLHFKTVSALARVKRMDLIIHFPTMDIKRNYARAGELFTAFLGTDEWKAVFKGPGDLGKLVDLLRDQLASFGYERESVRSLPIKNSLNNTLYHLFYATKHPTGNKIWESIASTAPSGQRSWSF